MNKQGDTATPEDLAKGIVCFPCQTENICRGLKRCQTLRDLASAVPAGEPTASEIHNRFCGHEGNICQACQLRDEPPFAPSPAIDVDGKEHAETPQCKYSNCKPVVSASPESQEEITDQWLTEWDAACAAGEAYNHDASLATEADKLAGYFTPPLSEQEFEMLQEATSPSMVRTLIAEIRRLRAANPPKVEEIADRCIQVARAGYPDEILRNVIEILGPFFTQVSQPPTNEVIRLRGLLKLADKLHSGHTGSCSNASPCHNCKIHAQISAELAAPVTPVSPPEVKGEIMNEHAKEVLELAKLFEFDEHLCVGHRKEEGFHVEFICLEPEDVRRIAAKLDMKSLRLQGLATDHIWLMEDGPESHPIGVRLDCGDSGVVYLSRTQAKDLAEQLTVSGNGPEPLPLQKVAEGRIESAEEYRKRKAAQPTPKGAEAK